MAPPQQSDRSNQNLLTEDGAQWPNKTVENQSAIEALTTKKLVPNNHEILATTTTPIITESDLSTSKPVFTATDLHVANPSTVMITTTASHNHPSAFFWPPAILGTTNQALSAQYLCGVAAASPLLPGPPPTTPISFHEVMHEYVTSYHPHMAFIGSPFFPTLAFNTQELQPYHRPAAPRPHSLAGVLHFIERLPEIPLSDLDQQSQECAICRGNYGESCSFNEGKPEMPVRLPCGHVFGKECIVVVLKPKEDAGW